MSHDLRSAHTRGLVPATSPVKSLRKGTGRRYLSHEQLTRSVLSNKSQIWIRGTSRRDQSWSLRLDFEAKNDSSFTRWDLSPRLVAGTSPLECATLRLRTHYAGKIEKATISSHFEFVFEENSGREITWLSCPCRFLNSSSLNESVFEKLHFRDGLVLTVGLTAEIKSQMLPSFTLINSYV